MARWQVLEQFSAIQEVTLLYPPPPGKEEPLAHSALSDLEPDQKAMVEALDLARYAAQ